MTWSFCKKKKILVCTKTKPEAIDENVDKQVALLLPITCNYGKNARFVRGSTVVLPVGMRRPQDGAKDDIQDTSSCSIGVSFRLTHTWQANRSSFSEADFGACPNNGRMLEAFS